MSGTLCFLIRLKRKGPAESLTKTKVTNLTNLTKPTKQKEENNSMRKNKSQKNREVLCRNLITKFSPGGSKTSIFWQGWIENSSRNREFVGTKKLARRYIQCLGTQDIPLSFAFHGFSRYAKMRIRGMLIRVPLEIWNSWKPKNWQDNTFSVLELKIPIYLLRFMESRAMIENLRYAKMACSRRDSTSLSNQSETQG